MLDDLLDGLLDGLLDDLLDYLLDDLLDDLLEDLSEAWEGPNETFPRPLSSLCGPPARHVLKKTGSEICASVCYDITRV